jgi:hypothetical protein
MYRPVITTQMSTGLKLKRSPLRLSLRDRLPEALQHRLAEGPRTRQEEGRRGRQAEALRNRAAEAMPPSAAGRPRCHATRRAPRRRPSHALIRRRARQ